MLKKLTLTLLLMAASNLVQANQAGDELVRNTVTKYLQAWGERDMKKVAALYVDDVLLYDLSTNSSLKGKEKVVQMETEVWLGSTPDMVWARTGKLYISGDTAIYEWIWTGTFTGKLDDINIIGKRFSLPGLSMTKVNKDGMITEQRDYYDMYSFRQQIGALGK